MPRHHYHPCYGLLFILVRKFCVTYSSFTRLLIHDKKNSVKFLQLQICIGGSISVLLTESSFIMHFSISANQTLEIWDWSPISVLWSFGMVSFVAKLTFYSAWYLDDTSIILEIKITCYDRNIFYFFSQICRRMHLNQGPG
jgi:hypothetical protein